MSKQIRKEVESVLGRELVGVERAWSIHMAQGGLVNPVDQAREILRRHIDNENRRITQMQNNVIELESQLRIVNGWTVVEA